MTKCRKILKVIKSKPVIEGAGVHLKRVFGFGETSLFDPFLLLDDFRSDDPRKYLPGFPWHPHRGIETITYMLNGSVEHGDSMGNSGRIGEGDVQWMTAGSGIIHQEMPMGDDRKRMGGFQLWANLPASHKMMDPRYREVTHSQIPEVSPATGVTIRVIAGSVNGTAGPVRDIVTDPEYIDVTIAAGVDFSHDIPAGRNAFAYCIDGKAVFCRAENPFGYAFEGSGYCDMPKTRFVDNGTLVLFGAGERISVTTETDPVRFLLISGRPLGEPVAWSGPIVMNTPEELQTAFEEYGNGTFIKFGNGHSGRRTRETRNNQPVQPFTRRVS
jgi:redox-sensitive bicupin YhaK (pirin superfamily)